MARPARLADWAEAAYAAPGVARACLTLQDEHGQSVCLLLWAAWAGVNGLAPDVPAAAALARTWEARVVGPLRAARRGLKTAPGLTDADRAALGARVRADELDAERALLAALAALAPGGGAAVGPLETMTAASAAWGRDCAPDEALARLAAAFPSG
jgi:uncharacterized protein (TIGR02444 family)